MSGVANLVTMGPAIQRRKNDITIISKQKHVYCYMSRASLDAERRVPYQIQIPFQMQVGNPRTPEFKIYRDTTSNQDRQLHQLASLSIT